MPGRSLCQQSIVRFAMAIYLGVVVSAQGSIAGSLELTQTTSLRQTQIYQGDIAELTIEYVSGIPSLYAIDTSVLETDFMVLDAHSSVSRVTEGEQASHRMHWAVQLVPRRSGNLQIPALKFGENLSEPMVLEVKPMSVLQQTQQTVFVEIEALPQNPYPGQQTRIITRLFHNLELYDSALAEPKTSPVQILRSAGDLRYKSIVSEVSYEVLERSILLVPNFDDQLFTEPAIYRGSIRPDNAVDEPASARYIYRQSNSLSLTLRELPPGFDDSNWLPAEHLDLKLEWDEMKTVPEQGDSLGVTLSLRASGLPGEVLPGDLLLHESEQYRIYADQEIRSTQIEGAPGEERFIGKLQQRYVIIFDQPGEISLPGLSMSWWDLDLDRAAIASVEAKVITVQNNETLTASNADAGENFDGVVNANRSLVRGLITPGLQHWYWLLLLPVGLLMVMLLRSAKPIYTRYLAKLQLIVKRRRCLHNLKQSCRCNNAPQCRHELIKWGRAHWQDDRISGLHQLARRGQSSHWARELARLDAAVFSRGAQDWYGHTLWEVIRQECKISSKRNQLQTSLLPGLYPQRQASLFHRTI